MRKIPALLALGVCLAMIGACSLSESDTKGTEVNIDEITSTETDSTFDANTFESDTVVINTIIDETQQPESDVTSADDTVESDTAVQLPYTENGMEIPSDKIFLNPDGDEFADKLQNYNRGIDEPIIQYWDTGKVLAKFELIPAANHENEFKINGRTIDFLYVAHIRQILVEDEFIIVEYVGTDTDPLSIDIYDHDCNVLLKMCYLSTSGMVHAGKITVTDNKITLRGTRLTHGPSLRMGCNRLIMDNFSEYSYYIYEDTLYDYGQITYNNDVYLDDSNLYYIKLLNPDEKTGAIFEMEYLGDGKFSKLNMVSYSTLREEYPYWEIEE